MTAPRTSPRPHSSPACWRSARPKPGNVSPDQHFPRHPLRGLPGQRGRDRSRARRRRPAYRSAPRSAPPSRPPGAGPGRTPTSASCCCSPRWRGRPRGPVAALRDGVRAVLRETTVADAAEVYAAIRLVRPGGLGTVGPRGRGRSPDRHPARGDDARRRAGQHGAGVRHRLRGDLRDRRAGAPGRAARMASPGPTRRSRGTFGLLAALPDTHIARKLGREAAERGVSARAARSRRAGGVRTPAGRRALAAFDAELRDPAQHAATRAPPPT